MIIWNLLYHVNWSTGELWFIDQLISFIDSFHLLNDSFTSDWFIAYTDVLDVLTDWLIDQLTASSMFQVHQALHQWVEVDEVVSVSASIL